MREIEMKERRTREGGNRKRNKKNKSKKEAISFAYLEFGGSVHPLLRNRNR